MMEWKNKAAFILALIGSAVGLGNIWRFPYIAHQEGIWFIISYLLSVALIGIPAFYLEINAGARGKKSLIELSKGFLKDFHFLIALPFLIVLVIMGYYTLVSGYIVALAIGSSGYYATLGLALLIHAAAIFVVRKGLNEGIEKANTYLVSLLFLTLIALFIYTQPWSHWGKIIGALDKPFHLSALLAGLSQAIFSLSIGTGLLYTYAMFSKPKELEKVAVVSALGDTIVAIMAMLILFTLSCAIPSQPEDFLFEVINGYFDESLFAHVFYLLLFSAAFTSIISFYSFLQFNAPKLIPLAPLLTLIIGLGRIIGVDLIYIADRWIVEPLLPVSLLLVMYIYYSYWKAKRS